MAKSGLWSSHRARWIISVACVWLCHSGAWGQDTSGYAGLKADSLFSLAIQERRADPAKSIRLFKLAQSRRDKSTEFSEKDFYREISSAYLVARQLDSSVYFMDKWEPLLEAGSLEQAEYFNSRASVVYYRGDYDAAIDFFLKSNRIYVALDDKPGQSRILNNLGAISEINNDFEGAKKYFIQSIEIKLVLNDSIGLSRSYNNLGLVLARLGNYEAAVEQYLKSVAIKEKLNDVAGLGSSYNNLAIEYKNLGRWNDAIKYSKLSLAIEKRLGRVGNQVNAYDNLAGTYYSLKNYPLGLKYADSALVAAKKADDPTFLKDVYQTFFKLHQALGNYKQALDFHLKHIAVRDSLVSAERTAHLDELKEKYESEIKERKINELEQEQLVSQLKAETDRQQKLLLLVLSLFVLGMAVLFYSRFRTKTKLNKQLDVANRELKELNATKDHLFAIISHDLKSPLSSFHTITKSLTDNWERIEKEQLKEFIVSLKDSSKEVHDMMDNLLRWALTQTGQLRFNPELVDPMEVTATVRKQLEGALLASNMTIEEIASSTARVKADKEYLQIVLRNLLSNAIKYSNMNTQVQVIVAESERGVEIKVKDQGAGIKEEDVVKLFSGDSTRVHDIRNVTNKGTGLGLLLCRELMDKMGGSIEVKSEWGKGSEFSLIFPKAA
jgi:signal transduction histidine kinase